MKFALLALFLLLGTVGCTNDTVAAKAAPAEKEFYVSDGGGTATCRIIRLDETHKALVCVGHNKVAVDVY